MALQAWVNSSLKQHFPATPLPAAPGRPLALHGALTERLAFQVGVRAEGVHEKVTVEVAAPRDWTVRVRRVGYVPLWHRNSIQIGRAHV